MASSKQNVPLAPPQPLLRQTSSRPRPPPSTPLRPKMANVGATEAPPVSVGILKCTCFRLPSRTSKKPPPLPPPPAPKLRSASSRSTVAPDKLAATASQSQRVTFRASISLSTRWPSSPSAASAGARVTPAPAGGGGSVVEPRRASASSAVVPTTMKDGAATASSSSFSYWRRRSPSSSRVMPHGERASFSFAVSPASSMSTPKILQGWRQK